MKATLALLLTLGTATQAALACECAAVTTDEALRFADAVFIGRVDTLGPTGRGGQAASFTTERWWKGSRAPVATVWTGTGMGDCGSAFDLSRRYLVFAWHERGALVTNFCVLTAPLPTPSDPRPISYRDPPFFVPDTALGPSLPPLPAVPLPPRLRPRTPAGDPLIGVAHPVFTGWRPVAFASAAVVVALGVGVWVGRRRRAA